MAPPMSAAYSAIYCSVNHMYATHPVGRAALQPASLNIATPDGGRRIGKAPRQRRWVATFIPEPLCAKLGPDRVRRAALTSC